MSKAAGCTCPAITVRSTACLVHGEAGVHASLDHDAALRAGLDARDRTAAKHEDDIVRLVPLAEALALRAGVGGVTTSDLRIFATQQGLLTGEEKGKTLSYLGAVMKRCGLHNTGQLRRSQIGRTHGIRQIVWVHASFTEGERGS